MSRTELREHAALAISAAGAPPRAPKTAHLSREWTATGGATPCRSALEPSVARPSVG